AEGRRAVARAAATGGRGLAVTVGTPPASSRSRLVRLQHHRGHGWYASSTIAVTVGTPPALSRSPRPRRCTARRARSAPGAAAARAVRGARPGPPTPRRDGPGPRRLR